ncbi:hypothetical protein LCGC14_2825590 [marine sediment metagenome]|uniref:Zinc-ribbon domain-containing protein n=1 Tax=marine sediment metagenome TaxID=412755 RepID=A0A0F8YFP1_9ZZZZ
MNIINCRECGGKFSDKDAKCPHCGAPSGKAPKKDELNENEKRTTEKKVPSGRALKKDELNENEKETTERKVPSGRALKKDELNENEKETTERNMDAEKSNSGDIAEEIRNIKLQYESMYNEMKELFEKMRAGHDIIGNKISWLDEQNEQRKKSLEDIISKTSSRYSL